MSTIALTTAPTDRVQKTRALCAVLAAIVVFDAVWVRAPFLAQFALPFAVGAWRYRGGRVGAAVLILFSALYVIVGVAFAASNGLHAPAEPGEATKTISPGDFAFAYIGTPVAAWLAVRFAGHLRRPTNR
jgi:hypothetical protein